MTANMYLSVNLDAMRAAAARLLADDAERPPASDLLDITRLCRGDLMLLIPEVEQAAYRWPRDHVLRECALAGVAEARRRLGLRFDGHLSHAEAHAKRLARSIDCLINHLEKLGGEGS